jgi:GTP-binding protein Era
MTLETNNAQKAGFVAIVGPPNAGKSTLFNHLVGMKLAAVTAKPQTTRNRIMGILNQPKGQIVLLDTPGIHQAGKNALNRYLVTQALQAIEDVDLILLLIEPYDHADTPRKPLSMILRRLRQTDTPVIVAINKIDTMKNRKTLLPLIQAWHQTGLCEEIVPISALKAENTKSLVRALFNALPSGLPLFPENIPTDRTERWLAGEIIREHFTRTMRKELPYSLAVVVEMFDERREHGDIVIKAVIYVERESQKSIVIGKHGQRLKQIGMFSRKDIEALVGCPVHLKLWVKTEPNWTKHERGLRTAGYDEG